jgi:phage gp46-like protein
MSDVQLFQSQNGGEINVTNGVVTLDETPFTAVYLSLFGGNIDDNGTTATRSKQYWANFDESDITRHMRSRTQAALIGLPAITANVQRVEEAALQDLDWLKRDLADDIKVTGSIPARNTVRLLVQITGRNGTKYPFDFTKPWGPNS